MEGGILSWKIGTLVGIDILKRRAVSLLDITNHAQEVPIIPLCRPTAVIWPWEAFGLCSQFEIVALGSSRTIFQFEKRFYFLFITM